MQSFIQLAAHSVSSTSDEERRIILRLQKSKTFAALLHLRSSDISLRLAVKLGILVKDNNAIGRELMLKQMPPNFFKAFL